MEAGRFRFERLARLKMWQLPEPDQSAVIERLKAFSEVPPRDWSAPDVKTLDGNEALYLIRLDDNLRAIVSAPEGQAPEVLDIVRQETLDLFAKPKELTSA